MVIWPGSWREFDARREGMRSATCGRAVALLARGWTTAYTMGRCPLRLARVAAFADCPAKRP
jgi:hypothetical protein